MSESLCIEISLVKPGEWRVVERSHRAAENVSRIIFQKKELDDVVAEINQCLLDANINQEVQRVRICRLGERLAEFVLPTSLRKKIAMSSVPVEFFLDESSIFLPVELFPNGETVLGEALPVLRHCICEHAVTSLPKQSGRSKQVLIVADPAENLPGAQKEGQELFRKMRSMGKGWHCRYLGRTVTVAELSKELPQTDLLHLAGHYISGESGTDSGVVVADGLWMPPPSSHTPDLAFINCCRAGLTINNGNGLSLVGRLLQQGSKHVIAPYLPVSDQTAKLFADAFYQLLFSGKDITHAMWGARKTIGPASWVYWHFGALTESSKTIVSRNRRTFTLVSIVIVLLIGFLIWRHISPRQPEYRGVSATKDTGSDEKTVFTNPLSTVSNSEKATARIAPDVGRNF